MQNRKFTIVTKLNKDGIKYPESINCLTTGIVMQIFLKCIGDFLYIILVSDDAYNPSKY